MHGLDTIIKLNNEAVKRAEARRKAEDKPPTLLDDARRTIELLGEAPRLSVHETLLLRFAQEIIRIHEVTTGPSELEKE